MKIPADDISMTMVAMLILGGIGIGIALARSDFPHAARHKSIDVEPRECVQTCIKAMQDNQVFPDFAAIVKECDARFGDGCKMIRDPE
jgi:hypothetical protein